jgi:hypothetical protein
VATWLGRQEGPQSIRLSWAPNGFPRRTLYRACGSIEQDSAASIAKGADAQQGLVHGWEHIDLTGRERKRGQREFGCVGGGHLLLVRDLDSKGCGGQLEVGKGGGRSKVMSCATGVNEYVGRGGA